MSDAHGVARDQLRAFVARIERLEEEKKTIADDIKDVYGEAKSMGFDTKVLKKLIGLRKKDEQERQEEELILDTYMAALGMIPQMDMFEDDAPKAKPPAMALQSPRKAAEAVSERTATNQPETATNSTAARKDEPSATAEDGRHLVGNEECQDKREEASHRQAGNQALSVDTHSPIAPASHGEAEAPAPKNVSLPVNERSGEGANTGGDHVDPDHSHAATAGTRINHIVPANPGITFEECPPKPMKRLPFAHCFPELTKSEYDQLSALIEERGVEEPIIRNGDTIIDGWNRYSIARSLGIAYPVKQFEGGDILSFVIAAQRSARDWLPSQERKIAAALCKELPHRANDIMAAFHIEEEFA